jgi:hypothetical protein
MRAATGDTPTGYRWKRTGDTWTNDQRFGARRFPKVYRSVSPSVLDLRVDRGPRFTSFTIYDRRGTVDSIRARP